VKRVWRWTKARMQEAQLRKEWILTRLIGAPLSRLARRRRVRQGETTTARRDGADRRSRA